MTDIAYSTTVFPVAVLGVAYEAGIAVHGNASAITAASVHSGALPNGLSLNADNARVTGTPTKLGTFTFTLQLTDTAGAVVSGSYSITVTAEIANAGLPQGSPIVTQLARLWPANYS